MKNVIFTVLTNEKLTDSVYKMTLSGDTKGIERPGQFVNIKLEGLYLRRPISVCDYEDGKLTIIYKVVGKGTEQMSKMQNGETLDVLTGLGNGYDLSLSGDAEATDTANKATATIALISMLLSGWSVMLFAFLNIGGVAVSYYWSCLFALIPILVCGFFYIAGAYGKRARSIKAQEEADRAAAAAAVAKPKKINYGGLPGTKPKKRKK